MTGIQGTMVALGTIGGHHGTTEVPGMIGVQGTMEVLGMIGTAEVPGMIGVQGIMEVPGMIGVQGMMVALGMIGGQETMVALGMVVVLGHLPLDLVLDLVLLHLDLPVFTLTGLMIIGVMTKTMFQNAILMEEHVVDQMSKLLIAQFVNANNLPLDLDLG